MEKIEKHFFKQLEKGRYLNVQALEKYAEKRKIATTVKELRKVRGRFMASAIFSRYQRPKKFQSTTGIARLGVIAADLAFFPKGWETSNEGHVGFLLAVAVATGRVWAIPFKDKGVESFTTAMGELMEGNVFPAFNTCLTDQEPAVVSALFQKRMKKDYGIRFFFLHRYATRKMAWFFRPYYFYFFCL
jgi:hypothetical protein